MQVICVAATKCDLPVRKVFEKEGREWASAHGFPFFEVGAWPRPRHDAGRKGLVSDASRPPCMQC